MPNFKSFPTLDFPSPDSHIEEWKFIPKRKLRNLYELDTKDIQESNWMISPPNAIQFQKQSKIENNFSFNFFPFDRTNAIAYEKSKNAHIINIPTNYKSEKTIYITQIAPGIKYNSFNLLQINLENFSVATLVIQQNGSGNISDNVEVCLGEGAKLNLIFVTEWNSDTVHLAAHQIRLDKNSEINYFHFTLGGELVRITPRVEFSAVGGVANFFGIYFADDNQFFEHRLLINHTQPNCVSRVIYKGALQNSLTTNQNEPHTVWVGDVVINSTAVGTNTYEVNRNLLLTSKTRADSVPNLEIETGEIIGAGHASTTGKISEEQLFYLTSRGITKNQARKLIVRGFFQEIITKIPESNIRKKLTETIELELQQSNN